MQFGIPTSGIAYHSITLVARTSMVCGIFTPSALAVFMLTINSNSVGCSTEPLMGSRRSAMVQGAMKVTEQLARKHRSEVPRGNGPGRSDTPHRQYVPVSADQKVSPGRDGHRDQIVVARVGRGRATRKPLEHYFRGAQNY